MPEVDSALQTGRITGCYGSPLTTVALQWNTKIKYQTAMPMSYGIGATVMSLDALKKLSADDQKIMLDIAKKMGKDIRKGVRKDNVEAGKQMKNQAIGSNYMFLARKPGSASLLDVLGPWPVYLVWLEVLALIMVGLMYVPYAVGDRFRRDRSRPAVAP